MIYLIQSAGYKVGENNSIINGEKKTIRYYELLKSKEQELKYELKLAE